MARLHDYARRITLRRGAYLIVSAPWERQFAVFLRGRCIATFPNRASALTFCKETPA